MTALAAAGPSAYWYLTRGTGTVALILLTLSVALGVANSRRLRTQRLPRFVVDGVHRNVSLLAVAFTVLHIVTSLLDSFAPISVVNAVVPFTGTYRPLWLGLGAVAFDLLIAVVITSVLRRRLGYRVWRLTHWAAYACWPVALLHTLGTGSDIKFGWMLVVVALCVAVVLAAVVVRATAGWPSQKGLRLGAVAGCVALPLALVIWLPGGPLAKGWAKKAGTPSYLLVSSTTASSAAGSGATPGGTSTSFTATANGTITQGESSDGLAAIELKLTISGQRLRALDVHILGQPVAGGGVEMTDSRVTLGSFSNPVEYRGHVTSLEGTSLSARLQGAHGAALQVLAQLQLNNGTGSVTGTVRVAPARA
jgi:sulfoxide reductase heme-binding subunit YedZ